MRASSLLLPVVLLSMVLPSCSRGTVSDARPPQTGPPKVRLDVVRWEARWFDSKDPARVAGSQQELTAASYILGHLEQAGYLVNLDPVPVGNLLHSTNVIALAPSGSASTVVVVDYDTSSSAPSDGAALGTFLETARAARASSPNHSVEFAALGAEHVAINGGQVGSRSLIELLKEQSPAPHIVRIAGFRPGSSQISATGPDAPAIRRAAAMDHVHVGTSDALPGDVFTNAGFAETRISGGFSLGAVLLSFLTHGSPVSTAP